jgi:DNA-binding MarR family transcriptional regulator
MRAAGLAALNHEVRGWQADQELFDQVAAELAGLNPTDWRCLDMLGTRGPMTAGQLAEAAQLTTGAVTGVLDHLEAAGLVRRVRDTVDRRRVIVEVTPEVARRAAPLYGPLVKDSLETLRVFDADQLDVITDFVRRQRGLLTRHTARARQLLAGRTGSAGPSPTSPSASCPREIAR